MGQIRQGDILLVPVAQAPPKDCEVRQEVVLAEGELTGHAHRVHAPTVKTWELDGDRYVLVDGAEPGALSHEDHDPTPAAVVEPGQTYRVVRQQEWDLSGQWRQVLD